MGKALDVEIEKDDLCYSIFRPVTDPKTGERFAEVRAYWNEGEDGVMCPIEDLVEVLDRNMTEDSDYYEGYAEAKAEAESKGELDDDWIVQYFIDFVNENAYEDPWDNPEIGNALSECHRVGKLREAGIPLDLEAEIEAFGVNIRYGNETFLLSFKDFAEWALGSYLPLPLTYLWRIVSQNRCKEESGEDAEHER